MNILDLFKQDTFDPIQAGAEARKKMKLRPGKRPPITPGDLERAQVHPSSSAGLAHTKEKHGTNDANESFHDELEKHTKKQPSIADMQKNLDHLQTVFDRNYQNSNDFREFARNKAIESKIKNLVQQIHAAKQLEEGSDGQTVSESGLQYSIGVGKHGKPYMVAAAKLMRNGGSQKQLGAVRDRLSKAYRNKKTSEGIEEAGPFRSTEPKKPRRGSVADLAARKRAEQDRTPQRQREIDAIGNKNHYVGTARVRHDKSDVSEGSDLPPKVIEMIKKIAQSSASPEHKKAAIDALVAKYSKKGVSEGSGPKEKQKTPYRDINSPEYRKAADKQKQQMAKDAAAEPGKKLADKIAKKGVAEGMTKDAMMNDAEKMSLEQFCDKYGDEDWVKEFYQTAVGTEDYESVQQGVAEGSSEYKDSYENEQELYSGCYVRDQQEGPGGEVFVMRGDPEDRRVRIEDRDGRGWYISPSRLELVDENDPAIRRYFGGISEGTESQYIAARYIDEFGDGDHWYVKGTPDVIKKFVLLANSLEDETVKGTEYEPGKGMMGGIHAELGNEAAPQWTVVPARNLEAIKPIGDKVLQRLMRPNLADGAQEFMSELLWAMEAKGLALVHDDSQQGVAEDISSTKKKISKYEELALAANRAGDDAKCKQYQQKIQVLKQKMSQGVAEGSSYQTDSMVSHISQIITDIYPQGGDKNTYMKLVARKMPRIVKNDPKLFRRAFGIAYDRFFHIDQDDDFDYTDYSMRQGELGNPNRGMREGSLNEFAPAGSGGGNTPRGPRGRDRDPWGGNDGPGDDPYKYPKPEHYRRSIDYFEKFEANHFDKEEFDEKTGVFKGYWFDRDAPNGLIQIGYFKFNNPAKNGDNDPGMGWYYEPEIDEGVAEGAMKELDIAHQDYKRMTPQQFYAAYKMTKADWLNKNKDLVKKPDTKK